MKKLVIKRYNYKDLMGVLYLSYTTCNIYELSFDVSRHFGARIFSPDYLGKEINGKRIVYREIHLVSVIYGLFKACNIDMINKSSKPFSGKYIGNKRLIEILFEAYKTTNSKKYTNDRLYMYDDKINKIWDGMDESSTRIIHDIFEGCNLIPV